MLMNFPQGLPRAALLSASLAIAACAQPTAPPLRPEPAAPEAATPAEVARSPQPEAQLVPLLEGLEHPWSLAWLPDDSLLITERPGRLRRVRAGQQSPDQIAGLPTVYAEGQGGLLDIAPHPRFAENQLLYFTYSAGTSQANRTQVARARLLGDRLQDWQVIFTASPAKPGGQHFGSRLLWLPDETLLVAIGDGGNPPVSVDGELIRLQAQKLESDLGKVVRLRDDGSIPDDNPVIDGRRSAVWSYGHRNIQGLARDPESDRLWVTEHGARGGDELNRLQAGENYGWPLVSHSRDYATRQPIGPTSQPGMTDPLLVWTPAIAPSGLAVYTGEVFPDWRGHLFAGGLVSRSVIQIAVDERSATVVATHAVGQRVRDVRQGPDGLLYILTDAANGQLLRLEPRP